MLIRFALAAMLILLTFAPSAAVERILLKESAGIPANDYDGPCPLSTSTNGTAANYRWYNVCSGYIWLYSGLVNEGVGVLFGGAEQPEVRGGNSIKRAVTYFRNTSSYYAVIVALDADVEGDGCPDFTLATSWLSPGERWNCSQFDLEIPCDLGHVIIRTTPDYDSANLALPTDGPFSNVCDPNSAARSFFYGINWSVCTPWVGPDGSPDNFLYWLVVDSSEPCPPNATAGRSWGEIKGLYR